MYLVPGSCASLSCYLPTSFPKQSLQQAVTLPITNGDSFYLTLQPFPLSLLPIAMAIHDEVLVSGRHGPVDVDNKPSELDEKSAYPSDDQLDHGKLESTIIASPVLEVEDTLYDANGKEKVLETPSDFANALVSLGDDPEMYVHTFRTWFIGIGLAVFGAVLGMLFVNSSLTALYDRC